MRLQVFFRIIVLFTFLATGFPQSSGITEFDPDFSTKPELIANSDDETDNQEISQWTTQEPPSDPQPVYDIAICCDTSHPNRVECENCESCIICRKVSLMMISPPFSPQRLIRDYQIGKAITHVTNSRFFARQPNP